MHDEIRDSLGAQLTASISAEAQLRTMTVRLHNFI